MESNTVQVSEITQESGDKTDDSFYHMPVLEDVDHPLVPQMNNEYIMREIKKGVKDVELFTYTLDNPKYSVRLIGEAGTGKNEIIKHVANECNWPVVRVSAGGHTTYEQLIGSFQPVGEGEQVEQGVNRYQAVQKTAQRIYETEGVEMSDAILAAENNVPEGNKFTFRYGILAQAFRYGWMGVVDEINGMDGENTMPLHQMMEKRDERELTILETGEVIEPHPNFRIVTTMNPPDYSGTNELNPAFKSRMFPIEFGYMDSRAEKAILKDQTEIVDNTSEFATEKLIELANNIRQQEQSGNEYRTKIGLRELFQVAELTEIMGIRKAVEQVFVATAEPTDKQGIEETIEGMKFDPNE